MSPRCQQVLKLLAEGPVTAVEAAAVYKIRQLPARIFDLKAMGFDISTRIRRDVTNQRYASYTLGGV
jgi:hypothetical protein